MTISVTCECGKTLFGPDRAAGKQGKCPGCGKILRMPEAAGINANAVQAPREPSPDALSLDAPPAPDAPAPPVAPMHASPDGEPEPEPGEPQSPWRRKPRKVEEEGPRRSPLQLGTFMGTPLTPAHIVGGLLGVGLVVTAVIWWLSLNADFNIIKAESVDMDVVLPSAEYKSTAQFKIGRQQDPNFVADPPKGATQLGGPDIVALTRPDPKGGFILARAEISRQIMHEEKMESDDNLAFRAHSFKIVSGTENIEPWLLVANVDSGETFNLYHMRSADPKVYLPDIKPAKKDVKRDDRGRLASGTYTFDGSNGATGTFKFACNYVSSELYGNFESLTPHGTIRYKTPAGATIKYEYNWGLRVAWSAGCEGWVSKASYVKAQGATTFAKIPVVLLFPKPKGNTATITYCGRNVGKINVESISNGTVLRVVGKQGATTKPGAVAGPGATPPTAAPVPGVPAVPGVTAPPGDAPVAGNKPPGAEEITDPLTGYLGAVGKARKKALGVMSDLNMAEMAKAIFLYVEQNKGRWPKDLDEVEKICPGTKEIASRPPRNGSQGYIYVQPPQDMGKLKSPETVAIIFESRGGQPDYTGNACYADGHVGHAPEK